MLGIYSSSFIRNAAPTILRCQHHSSISILPRRASDDHGSHQTKDKDYALKYMRLTAIFGAIMGGIGGGVFGHWSSELENNSPKNHLALSSSQKMFNTVSYTVTGAAAGVFMGFLAGPSLPPCLVLFGGHHILERLEQPHH
jgi:hypothetical protein